jgi:large subunit ribosomal protein L11
MPKEVIAKVKLQCPAGQATPAPPVGPTLGQYGVAPVEFCRRFNEATKSQPQGMIIPVLLTIYKDKSFEFTLKTPPSSILLKRAAGIVQGSPVPNKQKVGTLTRKQIEEIAKIKLKDLNTTDLKSAVKMIEGTARNMGIVIQD